MPHNINICRWKEGDNSCKLQLFRFIKNVERVKPIFFITGITVCAEFEKLYSKIIINKFSML